MPAKVIDNLLIRAEILARKNWLHAINVLADAEKLDPHDHRIFAQRGEIYLDRHQPKLAIESLQKALSLAPDQVHYNYLIGNCFLAMNDYRMALVYLEKIPNPPPEISYNRALALAYTGRLLESTAILRDTIRAGVNNPYFYYLLIEQLIRLDSFDEALAHDDEAIKRFGKLYHLSLFRAMIYYHKGIWLTAYSTYKEVEKQQTVKNPDNLWQYAKSAWKVGEFDHALLLFEQLLRQEPYDHQIYEDYLRFLLEMDNIQKAREIMRKAKENLRRLSPVLQLIQERLKQAGASS